jgi:hypothetical protein
MTVHDEAFGGSEYLPGLLETDEALDEVADDETLDEGYSPPERARASNYWGLTAREASGHEPLAARLSRELPEVQPLRGDGLGDVEDGDGEPYDREVGSARAGRLVDDGESEDEYMYAADVGVDGGASSAEEAAMHLVRDDWSYWTP